MSLAIHLRANCVSDSSENSTSITLKGGLFVAAFSFECMDLPSSPALARREIYKQLIKPYSATEIGGADAL